MELLKQHSSSDMRTIRKHSITPNLMTTIKRILEFHISKQNFEHILGNFGNPQILQPKFLTMSPMSQ